MDPLADVYSSYSPYSYVLGNPILLIDPDGMRVSLFDRMEEMGANHGPGPDDKEEENEDCCAGMGIAGAQAKSQSASAISETTGESYQDSYLELSRGEIDAGVEGVKEAVLMYVGGKAVQLIFRGGKWLYVGYVANRSMKAIRPISTKVKDLIQLLRPQNGVESVTTLYRGTTGSEGAGRFLFMTDEAAAAATYVKNGGTVVQAQVRSSALYELEARGLLTRLQDMHQGVRHTTFQFNSAELREALMLLTY